MFTSSLPEGGAAGAQLGPSPVHPTTFPNARFERITRIAAQSFDMPMALFALAGGGPCHSISQVGLAQAQAGLLASACGALLPREGVFVVDDILAEPRHAAIAMAVAGTGVRFCAGVPVRHPDGGGIGALWIFDQRPRQVDAGKLGMLADLAVLLERELGAARLEDRLAQREHDEARMRDLLDHLPDGVLMLGADGRIVSCNAVAETMYGAAAGRLVGHHSSELVAEDPARLRDALKAGERDQLQAIARRLDGSEFDAEFSVKLLDGADAPCYALVVRDVSRRKEEERLARIAEARRRKYFVTATHELRTPMTSVLGFSELLLKRDFDSSDRRELLEIVHRQTTRLVTLINEMLDLARIESGGKEALELAPRDAGAVLAHTLSGLEGLGANERIRCVLAPQLPPVLADAAKLQQALTNMISNAIKYSSAPSEIRVDVFEASLGAKPAVGFRVVDQGVGMTPEESAQVFDPFYRANSDQDTVGTGMGMAIFKEIVDLHGGVVHIASAPGAGTEITLLLPAAVDPA